MKILKGIASVASWVWHSTIGKLKKQDLNAAPIVIAALFPAVASAEVIGPDTSAIVAVVGRHAVAHACPISTGIALTSAHVIDMRPWDLDYPFMPSLYEASGQFGILQPWYAQVDRDLGVARGTFPHFYAIAQKPPEVGETVWFVGYKLSGKGVLEARIFRSTVQRIVAGHIVYTPGGQPGSSGSCVLNASGEVVAVNSFTFDDERAGVGIGVWPAVFALRDK